MLDLSNYKFELLVTHGHFPPIGMHGHLAGLVLYKDKPSISIITKDIESFVLRICDQTWV